MAVKRKVPLCLGLAAAGLVLSTSSVAFVGLPASKVPSETERQLRGQASVRMALNGEAYDLAPDAEVEEVSMGRIARASLAMLAALIVAVLPIADAHAGIGGKAPPTPAAAPPPPPPKGAKPATARSAVAPAAPVARTPPPPPARPLPPPPARTAPPPPPPSRAAPPPPEKVTIIEKNTTIIQAPPPAPIAVAPPAPGLGEMVAGAAVQGLVGGMVSGAVQSAMSGGGGGGSGGSGGAGADKMLEGQLRQDERQLDKQAMEIENIKMMLQAEMAKK